MATTNFVDSSTVIQADWLNDVDSFVYDTGPTVVSGLSNHIADVIDAHQASAIGYTVDGTGGILRTAKTKLQETISAADFGAVGDGTTDDTTAIQNAINSLSTRGGIVFLPPTGAAYKITSTITLGNGIILMGSLAKNYPGATATNAQWTAQGSWLNPTHAGSAVVLGGHGAGISGIGFIHVQPTPVGAWTPTTYGYCIEQTHSFTTIEDVIIVNASHGIHMNYTSVSGGGTAVRWRDVLISAFVVRMRTTCVNDTAYLSNIHCRNLWYSSDSNVVSYIRANTKGWYCGYTDNIMVDGLEFFEDAIGMYFENETCVGNTHSLYNATLSNVQFNLPQVCMKVAATTTTVYANLSNVLSQTGNAFGYTWSDTAFQLGSDNLELKFNGLAVQDAGGQLFTIGNGTGGKVVISDLDVDGYSTVAAGQVCFSVGAGSSLRLSNYRIVKPAGAGLRFAGAGLENVQTTAYGFILFLGRYSESTVAGSGAYQDFSTNSYYRPGQAGAHQIKLVGEMNVTVASAATTFSVRLNSGITGVEVTGISSATTGFKSFDSGWVDITEANLTSLSTIGNFQVNSPVGTTIANGSVNVVYR